MVYRNGEECVQVWINKPLINKLDLLLANLRLATGKAPRKGAYIDELLKKHLCEVEK